MAKRERCAIDIPPGRHEHMYNNTGIGRQPEQVDSMKLFGPEVFVIVRAFNEAKVIRDVVGELCRVFDRVVIVNDGSTDSTVANLNGLDVNIVSHCVNLGGGAALQTGLTYALSRGVSWILTFDADGQHRIEDAISLLRKLQSERCSVVFGSRFLGKAVNIPITRKMLLLAARQFSNFVSGTLLTDTHNGLRGFSKEAASLLDISQNKMAYVSEIVTQLCKGGMSIREIPVTIEYSEYSLAKGQSTLNFIN